jgi:hypothetical protein
MPRYLLLSLTLLLGTTILHSHPGSGIVVDREGNV